MAPEPESNYFPLESCLNGDNFVLPWSTAFSAITSSQIESYELDSTVRQFFAIPEVATILSKPFDAFSTPSAETKGKFNQRTAAINVTPSANSRYDLKEIKEDALWLSQAVTLDEVAALRIALVECQNRTCEQLLGGFTAEELTSIREAVGNDKYANSVPVSLLAQGVDPEDLKASFSSQIARRQRLLTTYLSERCSLLGCATVLLQSARSYDASSTVSKAAPSWLQAQGIDFLKKIDPANAVLSRSFVAIKSSLQNLEKGCVCFSADTDNAAMSLLWAKSQLTEIVHSMKIIFDMIASSPRITSSKIVLDWLRLIQSSQFFETLNTEEPSLNALGLVLQSSTAVISLAILRLGRCIDLLSDPANAITFKPANAPAEDEPYLFNKDVIYQIQALLLNAADEGFITAGPILLGWSALLQFLRLRVQETRYQIEADPQRDSSIGLELELPDIEYHDVITQIVESQPEDPIESLAVRAVDNCRVFEIISGISRQVFDARMRLVMLDLIQHTTAVGYIPEVVEALVSVVGGGRNYWSAHNTSDVPPTIDTSLVFFQQDDLVNAFLRNAASRFPLEPGPFLQLVRALASSPTSYRSGGVHPILEFLETLPIFTHQLPEGFIDYETIQEEDNNNNIRLLAPIELFRPRTTARTYGNEGNSLALAPIERDFLIAAGTNGRIISDSGPRIAFWFHEYSPLKYLGKILETYLSASNLIDTTTSSPPDRDTASEIIEILASLTLGLSSSEQSNNGSKQDAIRVLEIASSGLNRNRDIITVVFDIFEDELHKAPAHSDSEISLEVLVSCIHFMHALLPVFPRRIWPLLAQSGLLGHSRNGGRLSTIVEGIEVVSGQFEFLTSCCKLYEALVEELASNSVRRLSRTKTEARYVNEDDFETGVSDQILSKTLISFTSYLVDVLESSWIWKYADSDIRRELIKTITSTFDLVLQYAFGLVGSPGDDNRNLMGTFVPAASIIVEAFLSTSAGSLRFQALLCSYFEGLETPASTIKPSSTQEWTDYVVAILSFSTTLLRTSALAEKESSPFESQVFRVSPVIARLFATHVLYQRQTLLLFEALIAGASRKTTEPPSLLAHLGPATSRNFIQALSELDTSLRRRENIQTTWHFLSIIVSSRQQWFSNFLLTGKTPRAALQKEVAGKDAAPLKKSILEIALEKLTLLESIPRHGTLAILEFLSSAQNFWPWTVYNSTKYNDFIQSALAFVGELQPIQRSANALESVHQTQIAAHIAEILAMYLFHSRQTGTSIDLELIRTNLEYFTRFAVAVPSYNTSLHANLKRNFENRYRGCKLQDFQRSNLFHRPLGRTYFYDLPLAEKMLRFDKSWNGSNNNGLRNEVIMANINLSLVDAQITLFQNWKFLSLELSSKLSSESELRPLLGKVANDCLISNSRSQPPEEIFTSLSQSRTDLALILTQRLVQVESDDKEAKSLLINVWENIRTLRSSFERELLGSEIPYYRTLLKLLFLALRLHVSASAENLRASVLAQSATSLVPTLLDILRNVVASGIRELASSLHSTPSDAETTHTPEDLALLTGILQTILQVPSIELHSSSLVNIFSAASTTRVATTLFSWSDTLAQDGDPIYGELSMLFLLELSKIPAMAEQMAIDGVLGQITAANITSYIRRGVKVGPFVESAGGQRCYSIWVRGILPFLLNLLDGVQLPIAGEVSLFLSQFPTLLAQSSQAFDAPETNRLLAKGQAKFISLSSCSEVHSLALITYILNGFRQQPGGDAIVEVDWDASGVSENVEWWLGSRSILRDRIVPIGEREVSWSRRKGQDGEKSLLEEKVIAELLGVRDVFSASG